MSLYPIPEAWKSLPTLEEWRATQVKADQDARIRTVGGWLNPLDPRPGQIRIRDIARGLATQVRYKGQTGGLVTVAEHSVLVSRYVAPEHALQALLHDASEAFLGDMPGPIKAAPCMRWFRDIEDRLQAQIFEAFGVVTTPESDAVVDEIDHRMYVDEALALWDDLEGFEDEHEAYAQKCLERYGKPLDAWFDCWDWETAEATFLERYAELTTR